MAIYLTFETLLLQTVEYRVHFFVVTLENQFERLVDIQGLCHEE